MEIGIFLKGNVPSSKNSKNFTRINNKTLLLNSKAVNKYLANFEYQYFDNKNKKKFKEMLRGKKKPYQIKFTFTRDSKRKFDKSKHRRNYKWI